MKDWILSADWKFYAQVAAGVVAGASLALHALLKLKAWPRLAKIAKALDWCVDKLSMLALNAKLPK